MYCMYHFFHLLHPSLGIIDHIDLDGCRRLIVADTTADQAGATLLINHLKQNRVRLQTRRPTLQRHTGLTLSSLFTMTSMLLGPNHFDDRRRGLDLRQYDVNPDQTRPDHEIEIEIRTWVGR
jgi:hypothetical protein